MKTIGQIVTNLCDAIGGTTASEIAYAQRITSDAVNYVYGCHDWDRREREKISDETLVKNQESYDLPNDFLKMNSIRLKTVENYAGLNLFYWIDKNRSRVSIYPVPSKDGGSLEFTYAARQKNLTLSDYKTGTIATATKGSKSVTGTGTSWTTQMEGSYIVIERGWNVSGDGEFYQIAKVNSLTSLTLTRPYEGATISGSYTYLIGDVPLLNPDFMQLVEDRVLFLYNTKVKNHIAAKEYNTDFEMILKRMKSYEDSKTTSHTVENVGVYRKRL